MLVNRALKEAVCDLNPSFSEDDNDSVYNKGVSENKMEMNTDSEKEDGVCWMRDSKEAWLEKWWEVKVSCLKSRIQSKNRRKMRTSYISHTQNHNHGRVNRVDITPIDLVDFVHQVSSVSDCYSVKLHAPRGLGLTLLVRYDGNVQVEGLHPLQDGAPSPVQSCGLIEVGDFLIALNDINLEALDFYRCTELLKNLDKLAQEKEIALTFRYSDFIHDKTNHNCNASTYSGVEVDVAAVAAAALSECADCGEEMFDGDDSCDGECSDDDGPTLNLVKCQDQLLQRSGSLEATNGSNKNLAPQGRHSLQADLLQQQERKRESFDPKQNYLYQMQQDELRRKQKLLHMQQLQAQQSQRTVAVQEDDELFLEDSLLTLFGGGGGGGGGRGDARSKNNDSIAPLSSGKMNIFDRRD